ncbi:MAG: hypothetical protein J6X55_03305 [Victivallales bacterium]|nr:hypothetical protein [Victivallales bacterium]
MSNENAGIIGWKLGQIPNLFAILLGFFPCCAPIGLYNFHIILKEFEEKMSMNSSWHLIKILVIPFGMIEIEKAVVAMEKKYDVIPPAETFPVSLVTCVCCLYILIPFKLNSLLERANAVQNKMLSK